MANTPRRARAVPQGQAQGNAAPQGVPQPVQPPQRQIFLTPADANGNQFAYYFDARGNPRMVPGQQAPVAPLPGQQNQGYAPQGAVQPPAGGQPIVQQIVQPGNRLNIWKWLIYIILFLLLAGIALIGVVTLGPRLVEGFKFAFLESEFSSVCSNSAVYAPGWNQHGKAFVANGESEDGFEFVYQNRRNGINVGNGILVKVLPVGKEVQVWKVYEGCGAGQLPTIHSPP